MDKTILHLRQVLAAKMLQVMKDAKTGHLGACCSSLELMTVLYFGGILRYDSNDARHPGRDYVLNRGHLGPLKYSIFNMIGWMQDEELKHYRSFGSRLAGHEDMFLTPGVDISPNGSLGMLLSYAVGAQIGFKDQGMPNRTFCFLGDGEEQEGNVSEAARHAAHSGIKNLICVIDKNNGQLSTRPKHTDSKSNLAVIWKGYGWHTIELPNGHDMDAILAAYQRAITLAESGPVVIIAHTVKGNGIEGAEDDFCGFHVLHGSEPGEDVRHIDIEKTLQLLLAEDMSYHVPIRTLHPVISEPVVPMNDRVFPLDIYHTDKSEFSYDFEDKLLRFLDATLGTKLYIITSDYPIRSLTYSPDEFPLKNCHYMNVGIREQHMTAMIHGIMCVRPSARCVVLCGDAFQYRHADQMNILAQAKTQVLFLSVQSGLSGAKNGSSHQSSGQSGMYLTMPGMYVAEPSTLDEFLSVMTEGLWNTNGPAYIRLHKDSMVGSFGSSNHQFGYTLVDDWHDVPDMTIVSSGMIMNEAFKAKQELLKKGIRCNVISVYGLSNCLNPMCDIGMHIPDGAPLIICYNGNPFILSSVIMQNMINARRLPSVVIQKGFMIGKTGSMPDLLKHFGLDAESLQIECLENAEKIAL